MSKWKWSDGLWEVGRADFLGVVAGILVTFHAAAAAEVRPYTVCEVLENFPQHVGKTVAVVGRLSSNLFDGVWLSESRCSSGIKGSDPNWPYAIFVGCTSEVRPKPLDKLVLDEQALRDALSRLRKTTSLAYHDIVLVPPTGQKRSSEKLVKVQRKETWSVVYGRLELAPLGSGRFGAIRAPAQLCEVEGTRRDIEEPDSQASQPQK